MDKHIKQIMHIVFSAIILFVALWNLDVVFSLLKKFWILVFPVALGAIIAFLLNVPMSSIEHALTTCFERISIKPPRKFLRILSIIITFICIALVLMLVSTLVIPELISSAKSIYATALEKLPQWMAALNSHNIDTSWISEWLSTVDLAKFNLPELAKNILGSAGNVVSTVFSAAMSTVGTMISIVSAVIIAIYALASKNTLARQCKKLLYAYLRKPTAEHVCRAGKLLCETFSKFLSGQCLEAVILGSLMLFAFSVAGLPYASLVGILTGIFSLIPYIGAFLACFIGVILILMVSPIKALIALIVFLVVQFIEGQFIYPRVVGSSVGLSPMWTLIAVLLGGKLLGLVGMIFFIPLTASLYTLIGEHANSRLNKKDIVIE